MRDYGKVTTDIWMQQDMGLMEKSLLAYLHSGPHTNWIGCFYCPAGYAAEDLCVPVSRVRKAFAVLAEKGLIRVNGKMVFLPGFIDLNPVENGNTATARFKTFMALPAGEHKGWVAAEMLQYLRHLSDEHRAVLEGFVPQTVPQTVAGTVAGTVTGTVRVIEKEKEKEERETDTTTGTSPVVGRAQAHAPTASAAPPVDNFSEPQGLAEQAIAKPEKIEPPEVGRDYGRDELPTAEPEKPPRTARKKPDKGQTLGVDDVVAEGVARQYAQDWMTARRAKGVGLTRSELDANKREAASAGISFAQAVQVCAENGWRGFKAQYWRNLQNRSTFALARASPNGCANASGSLVRPQSEPAFDGAYARLFGVTIDAAV